MNNVINPEALDRLGATEARLAGLLARPKIVAIGCIVLLAGLGWSACGVMLARPGNGVLDVMCRASPAGGLGENGVLVFAMWAAMVLAMMLPSAGPMILTYAEIADTAARKGERIVSPLVLATGYVVVWFGFAAVAAAAQIASAALYAPNAYGLAATFLLAGAYQFSRLKHICLNHCQRPFPFFFAHWTTRPRGVFALGLRQGLYCLGCCWALMLLMFAVGAMNVLWMAALGALMTIEKMSTTPQFSRVLGIGLLAIAMLLVIAELR